MTARRVSMITGVVVMLSAVVLLMTGETAWDALTLSVFPGGAALVVGGIGATILDRFRHRPFAWQVTAVTLTAVGAAGAGTLVGLTTMSFSADETWALGVAIAVAATVGVVAGLALASRVMRAAELLQAAARHVDGAGHVAVPVEIRELADVGDELESAAARLVAERARRELVSWVSHDLRSPLAGISAITDALIEDADAHPFDPDRVTRHMQRLRMETDRLTGLVEDLAQLSRVESGRLHLQFEEVSLSDLVSDAIAAVEHVADAKGVRVHGAVLDAPPPTPLAAAELSRVFSNLLDNAVRATPSGGVVAVEVATDDDGAAFVSITDECGGFRQQPGARSQSGLGLVIARGFVEAHGGELSMSDNGRGCQHVVRLPKVGSPATDR